MHRRISSPKMVHAFGLFNILFIAEYTSKEKSNYRQTVTDRRGFSIVFEHDSKGNVTKKTDPLNNVKDWTFDDRGNMETEILKDALGRVLSRKSRQYDEDDNKLFEHHLQSEGGVLTTAHTYSNKGQVLTTTDPKNNTTRYEYDDKGELEMITEPAGKITKNTYYENGTLETMSVCGYPPTVYIYYDDGNVRTETDPLGSLTEYTYSKGRMETETKHAPPKTRPTIRSWFQ